jgi:hypothetical protein
MATELTKLTHKIATKLQLVAENCTIYVLAPGSQSGNFWTHRRRPTILFPEQFGYSILRSSGLSEFQGLGQAQNVLRDNFMKAKN